MAHTPSDATPVLLKPSLKNDLLASVVVFLVALPLCMGIALASGAPASAGLVTGIVAGIIVGFLAGSPLQVSGPAAGLSVVVLELIMRHRQIYLAAKFPDLATLSPRMRNLAEGQAIEYALTVLGLIVLLAGAIQLLAGLLRLGQWFRAVSPAVIHGMLAGIGVLIFVSQFHVMIDDQPRGSGWQNLVTLPESLIKGLWPSDNESSVHEWAMRMGLLTIVMLVAWKLLAPKKLKSIPAPLVGVLVATTAVVWLGLEIRHVDMPDELLTTLRWPTDDWLGLLTQGPIWVSAVTLAVIASAETLLCASAVDKMHTGPRTRYDRELAAQGVGNMICGAMGGLPMTGVIVRSAANVEAGGTSRRPAILHGFWLLGLAVFFPHVLEWIPTASLAAILVFTGYKLVDIQSIRSLWRASRGEVVIYFATLGFIVATDLLTGVLVGVALSAAKLLYTFSRLRIRTEVDPEHRRTTLFLRGTATFLRLPQLAAALEAVPANTELHVRLEDLDYIDHACLDLLISWEKQHEATGGSLVIDWDTLTAHFRKPKRRSGDTTVIKKGASLNVVPPGTEPGEPIRRSA